MAEASAAAVAGPDAPAGALLSTGGSKAASVASAVVAGTASELVGNVEDAGTSVEAEGVALVVAADVLAAVATTVVAGVGLGVKEVFGSFGSAVTIGDPVGVVPGPEVADRVNALELATGVAIGCVVLGSPVLGSPVLASPVLASPAGSPCV